MIGDINAVILPTIAAIVVVFFALVIIRTLRFTPRGQSPECTDAVSVDIGKAAHGLSELIKCRTVSRYGHEGEDGGEFDRLTGMLPQLYPEVYRVCTLMTFPDRALLYRWEGRSQDAPSVFMAHYDVVPADAEDWEIEPFSGLIRDGVLWGRGSLDTKVTFSGILYAADQLIREGFVPENDIYLAFSGCEEVSGPGAEHIVRYFEENGIEPGMVIDEGGAVVQGAFPGLDEPCAYIGIAEKGMMDVEYRVRSSGGHASAPKPHTPVGILSRACCRVEAKPFKSHLTEPVRQMYDTLGRHSSFFYRMIFANMWCFGWVIDLLGRSQGGEINALMRTTAAFTQMSGSEASNVIPPEASMVSNLRLNPDDTVDSALEYLRSAVNDSDVELQVLRGHNPSRISTTECEGYERIVNAVTSTWKGCIPTPYLMVQCSDSRHWGRISDRVYRFSAMDLTAEERAAIHGNNEGIRLECLSRTCEFFIRLMKNS